MTNEENPGKELVSQAAQELGIMDRIRGGQVFLALRRMKCFQSQWHEEGHSIKSKHRVQRKDLSGNSGVVPWGGGDGHAPREKQARMPLEYIQLF